MFKFFQPMANNIGRTKHLTYRLLIIILVKQFSLFVNNLFNIIHIKGLRLKSSFRYNITISKIDICKL